MQTDLGRWNVGMILELGKNILEHINVEKMK